MKKFMSLACAVATAVTCASTILPASAIDDGKATVAVESRTSGDKNAMKSTDFIYFDIYIKDVTGLGTNEDGDVTTGVTSAGIFYKFDNTQLTFDKASSTVATGFKIANLTRNGIAQVAVQNSGISADDSSTYVTDLSKPIASLAFTPSGVSDLTNFTVKLEPNYIAPATNKAQNLTLRVAAFDETNWTTTPTDFTSLDGSFTANAGTFTVTPPAVATTYAVTLGEGATTDYTGDLTAVPENTEITVTAAEKSGYTATLKKDGVAVTSPYKFAVTANTTFTVEYTAIVPENPHKYTLDDKGTCMKDTVKGIYYSLSVKNVANKLAIKVSDKVFEATGIPEVTGDTVSKLTYVILGVPDEIYNPVPGLGGVTSGETVFDAE